MGSLTVSDFGGYFRELHGKSAYDWQMRLAQRLTNGTWPAYIDLPTGSGKTSCLDIAVFALACQAALDKAKRTAPRRIFFCVNRRVIVDEAHERALRIARKIERAESDAASYPVLALVAAALRELSGTAREDGPPLDVLELRGGIYRDNRWARSATQPTIVCTTIDQLGSRLLFRGYGVSSNAAPAQAALIAYDSLVLLDEAHISEPFRQTLASVRRYLDSDLWALTRFGVQPMVFVPMTATPPDGARDADAIRLEAKDRENSDLDNRLKVSKQTTLSSVSDIVKSAAIEAKSLSGDSPTAVGIILNRVDRAKAVYKQLRAGNPDTAVELVIGSMRPIDRDQQAARLGPLVGPCRPKISNLTSFVVATQCLEVGADYDFDVLVTECASLDALRQRFGRLNRAGRPIEARAVILIDSKQVKEDSQLDHDNPVDPIYGNALSRTWNWLNEHSEAHRIEETPSLTKQRKRRPDTQPPSEVRCVDFGIDAFEAALRQNGEKGGIPDALSAPSAMRAAPVMLPAYVDIWCQTSPSPKPEPGVSFFIHGPQSGEPDVQVCWRADLVDDGDREKKERWCDVVALAPPSSAECMSVPISRVRRWLADEAATSDQGDLLGAQESQAATGQARKGATAPGRPLLASRAGVLWRGARSSESKIIVSLDDLGPGDTLVLPARAEGWAELGHVPTAAPIDIAEMAFLRARDRVIQRFHPDLRSMYPVSPAIAELLERVQDLNEPPSQPDLRRLLIDVAESVGSEDIELASRCRSLANQKLGLIREFYPDSRGVVLATRRRVGAANSLYLPILDDGEDDCSRTTRRSSVGLAVHTAHVREAVMRAVARLPLDELSSVYRSAADLHDLGKADERFQAMLQRTDRTDAWLTTGMDSALLAKSERMAQTREQRRQSRERAGLPEGFRHEMLSVQLAELVGKTFASELNRDLVLHLVAAHHGFARPFAPVVNDDDPPEWTRVAGVRLGANDRRAFVPHRLESGIAERFWTLTRQYGWWGLAYLEAVLRLADQEASADEDARDEESRAQPGVETDTFAYSSSSRLPASPPPSGMLLGGIDGSNPLGLLAALGTLQTLAIARSNESISMSWAEHSLAWRPSIHGYEGDLSQLAKEIAQRLACPFAPDPYSEAKLEVAREKFEDSRKRFRSALDAIKKQGMRGKARTAEEKRVLEPLRETMTALRKDWLESLESCVPSLELSLGKHLEATVEELRDANQRALDRSSAFERDVVDLFASFGSDACAAKDGERMQPTPFCFITGSGHQYFLDTVRQLAGKLDAPQFERALSLDTEPCDERLSMRWDPLEDRRYSLMWSDPTAAGNVAMTRWAFNLLAYRGLSLLPCVPARKGLGATGWAGGREPSFTWPIWSGAASASVVRSLLSHPALAQSNPDARYLYALGVRAVYRSDRIQVGNPPLHKVNFSPAQRIA
jgi:CRISPR-associated endonuclease/helicase Cas3